MTTAHALMAAEDLSRMADDGQRHELIRGELTMMAPAGGGHGETAMTVAYVLMAHVKTKEFGKVLAAETGFIISRDPDTVRAPDVAFVSKRPIPADGLPATFIPFAPDIAVEVLLPSDLLLDVERRLGNGSMPARRWYGP